MVKARPTFPPAGWCFTLSIEPILERALLASVAEPGWVVALWVVEEEAEEAGRVVRTPAAFFSGAVGVEDVAGLAAVARGRAAAVVVAELRVAVVAVVLGLLASATGGDISIVYIIVAVNIHLFIII